MKRWLLLITLWVVLPVAFAQDVDYKALDKYIGQAVESYDLPGLAIAIVKDDKVVFSKGYGVQHTGNKSKVDGQSMFAIASVSKAFTTAAIASLVEDKKLAWSDKVKDYLPHFELHDPYISNQMTIEDLLCHRSGLITYDGDLLWYGTDYSRKEIIERIRHRPLTYGHREQFGYQNIMFITAGELVPAVTGKSWDDYLSDTFFKPLGMSSTNTSVTKFKADDDNLAYPHIDRKPIPMLNYDNSGGTAAINSCTDDMAQWIRFWLNEGKMGNDQLLEASSINRIFTPHTNLNASSWDLKNGTHFKSYGMGWFLMDYQGVKVVHHGGGLPGYISKIALVPEKELGVIVLTNGMSGLPTALMYKVIDAHLGIEVQDWAKIYNGGDRQKAQEAKDREAREKSRVADTQPSHELIDYTGSYVDDMYGDASVSLENGQLKLVMEPTKKIFSSTMKHWHYDTFEVTFDDPFLPNGYVSFEFDSKGAVTGLKIDLPNPDFHFYKLDFKKVR